MSRTTTSHRAARFLVAVAAAVVALLVATMPPAGAADAVDPAPPRLTAVSLTPSDVTPGGALRLTYTFVAESPVVSAQATLRNRYASSEYIHLSEVGRPVTGTMTYTVPATAYSGDYLLTTVTLVDAAGNSATTNYSYGQHWTHISGTSNDGEPPELTGLSLANAARYADESTTVTYAVSDTSLPLRQLSLYYATGLSLDVPKAKASGTLVLGGPGAPGPQRFDSVHVVDGKGNWATYFRDGTVHRAAVGHPPLVERHSLAVSALDFTPAPAPPGGETRALPRGA